MSDQEIDQIFEIVWSNGYMSKQNTPKLPDDYEEARELLTTKIAEIVEEDKSRYCGACFLPCFEQGGWRCEAHGYKSVYISRSEAESCRAVLEAGLKGESMTTPPNDNLREAVVDILRPLE